MRTLFLALVLGFLALFAGCIIAIGDGATDGSWCWSQHTVRGSGTPATQSREVGAFHAIRIEGSCDVEAHVGPACSVSVTADDNLIDYLVARVENGVLVLTTRDGATVSWRVRPRAVITAPSLDSLAIAGSGDAVIDGIAADAFAAHISGSGDMRLSGRTTKLDVSVSGSGDGDLVHLDSQDASVSISGSGDLRVACSGNLSISISGSGDVAYAGSPRVSISISGSGDVAALH